MITVGPRYGSVLGRSKKIFQFQNNANFLALNPQNFKFSGYKGIFPKKYALKFKNRLVIAGFKSGLNTYFDHIFL